jgi:succinate dehydrogenase / fumarate reductase cytochrome b subunit
MADITPGNRPISPHLTIYRRSLTMMMSITHRITGCGMALGGLLVVWWFLAAARGPERFDRVNWLLSSWLGGLVMIGLLACLWYHFFNGIRHLMWDTGAGFEVSGLRNTGMVVLGATAVMTVITLIIGWV